MSQYGFSGDHHRSRAMIHQTCSSIMRLMVWAFAIEFIFGDGEILSGLADLSALILFAALAMATGERLHAGLNIAAWVLIIALLALAGFGIIG